MRRQANHKMHGTTGHASHGKTTQAKPKSGRKAHTQSKRTRTNKLRGMMI